MTYRQTLRIGAFASWTSGLLLTVGWTMNIERDSLLGASLVVAGYVLTVFASMGLYVAQAHRIGWGGLLGFTLVILGCVFFVPFVFLDIARISVAPEIDRMLIETTGVTYIFGVVGGLSFMLGFVLAGTFTIRAGLLSRWPAMLLVVAGLMPMFHPWLGISKLLARVGGLAFIGLGISLWSHTGRAVRYRQE